MKTVDSHSYTRKRRNDAIQAGDRFAADFARTPADLQELSANIREILSLVSDEWRGLDNSVSSANASDRAYSGASPDSLTAWLRETIGDVLPETGELDEQSPQPEWRSELLRGIVRHSIQLRAAATAAHLHCLPLRDSISAEVLIALLNQSMDSFDQSGVATLLETELVRWLLRECLGEQPGHERPASRGDGVFTSGGTQSNLMGLLLAREAAVRKFFGASAFQSGLPAGAEKLRILCQQHAHFSATQAAGLLGLGRDAIVPIPVKAGDGGVDINAAREKYEELKAADLLPFCFFATAGTTDRGAIDDLSAVGAFCEEHELWFHLDAAYGGALLFTRHRHRLRGVERVDSLTVDFHKLFFQPIACGAFLVRDAQSFALMRQHADYLNREEDIFPNLVDRSLATTRRFDALKLLFSLKGVGRARFEAMIDRLLELTRHARDLVVDEPELELLVEPALSTVLFRYRGPDALNSAIRDRLLSSGAAIIGETRFETKVALKLTLMNPTVQDEDIAALLQRIVQAAREINEITESNTSNPTEN